MITFTPVENIITIGEIDFSTKGTFLMIGILIAYILIRKTALRRGLSAIAIDDLAILTLIGGIISARLFAVILHFPYYQENPLEIIKIWNGELDVYGGILGILLCATFYIKQKKIQFWHYMETIAPHLLIIGSTSAFGNFINAQMMGIQTNTEWGVISGDGQVRYPTQLVIAVILISAFFFIRKFQKNHPEKYAGYFFFLTSGVYFIQHFCADFLTDYTREETIINYKFFSQTFALLLLVITAYGAWQQGTKEAYKKRIRKQLDARTTQW